MAWRWGMRLLGLISTLILVRLIRPSDFGLIALASSFMQTIDGLATLGTEEAVIREADPAKAFYDTAFTVNLLRGASVTLCVAALAFPAAAFFGDARLGPVLLFIACLPVLDGLTNIGTVDFRRDFAFHKEFAMMVLPKLCGILAAISAAVILKSYVAMLCGMAVNRTMRVIMSYVMHPHRPSLTLRAWDQLAGYSVWTWLFSLAVLVRDRIDTLFVGRGISTAAVGFFAAGAEIAALPTTELIEPLGRAAFSGFAKVRQLQAEPGEMFLRLIGSATVLALPAGAGLSLLAGPLVALAFGPGWSQAVPVVRVLAVGATVMVLGHLSLHLLSAYALLRQLVIVTVVAAAFRVALLASLIPVWGLSGAALGAAAAMTAEQGWTMRLAMRCFGVSAGRLLQHTWRPLTATAVMTLLLTATSVCRATSPGLAALVMPGLLGAVCYILVLAALWLAAGRPDGAEADLLTLLRRR